MMLKTLKRSTLLLFGFVVVSCSHFSNTPTPPCSALRNQLIISHQSQPRHGKETTLKLQARAILTGTSKQQDSLTLLGQFSDKNLQLELWLLSDFGSVIYHGTSMAQSQSVAEFNRSPFSTKQLNKQLIQPLMDALMISLLYSESALTEAINEYLLFNHSNQPCALVCDPSINTANIQLKKWITLPSGRLIPQIISLSSEKPFFETQLIMLEINEI